MKLLRVGRTEKQAH